MYKQISKKISDAKKGGDRESIRLALLFLVSEIESLIDLSSDVLIRTLPFSQFIEDSDFLFESDNQEVFSAGMANLRISTDGLIAETLNIYGVSNGKEVSNDLKMAIFSLHSKLSRGVSEIKSEIDTLKSSLDNLKKKIVD